MRNRYYAILILVYMLISLFNGPVYWKQVSNSEKENVVGMKRDDPIDNSEYIEPDSPFNAENDHAGQYRAGNQFAISEGSQEGILNSLSIEQSAANSELIGYLDAWTDQNPAPQTNLSLDIANNWKGEQVELNVQNLTKLYALNGTFDNGLLGVNLNPKRNVLYHPLGWDADSDDFSGQQHQRASYLDISQKYLLLENEGRDEEGNGVEYEHYQNSYVSWFQDITYVPSSETFLFSFNYLYDRGPLGSNFKESFYLTVKLTNEITVWDIWDVDLTSLNNRDTWYSLDPVTVSWSGLPANLTLIISLEIAQTKKIKSIDNACDGDPSNAKFITCLFDNVSLIASDPPEFSDAGLKVSINPVGDTPISGSGGVGSVLVNHTYWENTPVTLTFSADLFVSFQYKARFSHLVRSMNSSWTTDDTKVGVSYTVELGQSPSLTFYSYVDYHKNYENLKLIVEHPPDWNNVTVYDVFSSDVTSSSISGEGFIEISGSVLNRTGWWKFTLESPNYAKEIAPQVFDSGTSQWQNETVFRSENSTRASIWIGTLQSTPDPLDNVNVTWIQPNDTIWSEDQVSGGLNGNINSSARVLGSQNATPGLWSVVISWTNGSEIACDTATFELHHSTSLIPLVAKIETNTGMVVTGAVQYMDIDSGTMILDSYSTVVGNWSGPVIEFGIDIAHNTWEADFDTSLLAGPGNYTVVVNASRPFYDNSSCLVLIECLSATKLTSPNSPWTSAQWNTTTALTLHYESYDFKTETWSPVENLSNDVSIWVNWTDGNWSVSEGAPGFYQVDINTGAKSAGTWVLNLTASKPFYETQNLIMTLISDPNASSLYVLGNETVQIQNEGSYELKVRFVDHQSDPVTGANVSIQSISPATGIFASPVEEVLGEPGNYSVTLTPSVPDVYIVTLTAAKDNIKNSSAVFVLEAVGIATELLYLGEGIVELGLGGIYNASFRYQYLNNTGIQDASIDVLFWDGPAGGLNWSSTYPVVGERGNYTIEFGVNTTGTYMITIKGEKENHQSDSTFFFILVGDIQTELVLKGDISAIVDLGSNYTVTVQYTNSTGAGLENATVEIAQLSPSTGLNISETYYEANGNYSMVLTAVTANTYTMVIRASLINHQTKFVTFTLTASPIASFLTVTPSSDAVALDLNYTVTLSFFNETFGGLENASVSVFSMSPSVGVIYSEAKDLGEGNYSITITPQIKGTYEFVFKASLLNHHTGTATFTLAVTAIPTDLRSNDGSTAATVSFNEVRNLILLLERTDLSENVTSADIEVRSTPEVGLSYNISEGSGYYNITLSSEELGSWVLTITASKPAHINSTIQFIFEVIAIPTTLIKTFPPGIVYVNNSYSLDYRYNFSSVQGIDNASIVYIGLAADEISWKPGGNGWYNVTLTPRSIGDYGSITLKFSREGYDEQSVVFSFEVRKIETSLIGDDVPTSMYYGLSYSLVMTYNSSVQGGVTNADIAFSGISSDQISWVELGDGLYNITISAKQVGNFTDSEIRFYKEGFEVQVLLFSFEVKYIETSLTGTAPPETLYYGRNTTFSLLFNSSFAGGIDNIEPVCSGLDREEWYKNATGNGWYNITVIPSQLGAYSVAFRFEKEGFETRTFEFPITVVAIPMDIGLESQIKSNYSVVEGSGLEITVHLVENDTRDSVTSATVHCEVVRLYNVFISVIMDEITPGVYSTSITVPSSNEGCYNLTISASKKNYRNFEYRIELFSKLIIMTEGPLSGLKNTYNETEGSLLQVVLHLVDASTNESINGATVHYYLFNASVMHDGILIETDVEGIYSADITIPDISESGYNFTIVAERDHCENFTHNATLLSHLLKMEIGEIGSEIPILVVENRTYSLNFTLVNKISGEAIENATIYWEIFLGSQLYDSGTFEESSGTYLATIKWPKPDEGYELVITAKKEHYYDFTIRKSFVSDVDYERQTQAMIAFATQAVSGILIIFGILAITYMGRRRHQRQKREKHAAIMDAKRKFDDAKNIIAFLILHSRTGLPVYSKMFKVGFEEVMISGFISAITTFRTEFKEEKKLWNAIPLSDIITTVHTKTLIFALITGDTPSKAQIEKLESLSFALGSLYDDQLEDISYLTEDILADMAEIIEPTFYDILGGSLLQKLTWSPVDKISKRFRPLKEAVDGLADQECFTSEECVKAMVSNGIDEGVASLLVIDGITLAHLKEVDTKLTVEPTPKPEEQPEELEEYSEPPLEEPSEEMSELKAAEELLRMIDEYESEKVEKSSESEEED